MEYEDEVSTPYSPIEETDTKNEEAKETKNDPVETTDTPNTANIEPSEDTEEVFDSADANKLTALIKPVFLTVVLSTIAVCQIREPKVVQLLKQSLGAYAINLAVARGNSDSHGNPDNAIGASAASAAPGDVFLWAVINACVFIVFIAAMTFLLVLLFKFRCYKALYGLMSFTICIALSMINGMLLYQILTLSGLPVDDVTLGFVLINFSVAGAIGILYGKGVPAIMVQAYLVNISICIAYQFSFLPQWTTWTLLVALALWDLFAVLTPCGPLKMLIELAQKRQDPVPDDPFDQVNNNGGRPHLKSTNELRGLAGGEIEEPPESYNPPSPDAFSRPEQEEQEVSPSTFPVGETQSEPDTGPSLTETSTREEAPPAPVSPTDIEPLSPHTSVEEPESTGSEVATTSPTPLSLAPTTPTPTPSSPETATPKPRKQSSPPAPANNSVKLGLGDFIFYSLLVSKAALTGWVAFASCFCVVICGLIGTMILLFVLEKALPALPFSMMFGVGFYFLAQFIMDPYFANATMQTLYV